MRATLFFSAKDLKATAHTGDTKFVSLDMDGTTIFFDGYGQENVTICREIAGKLLKAANELQDAIFEQEFMTPEPVDEFGSSLDQHDTREEHRGEV